MKISSAPPGRPLKRSEAIGYMLINLCATPGLGSWMGRRRKAAVGQISVALIGFFMIVGWMFGTMWLGLREAGVDVVAPKFLLDHPNGVGIAGVVVFGIAWVWSLVTSISMIMGAKENSTPAVQTPPPMPWV